ncbi:MAG: hypothetical protein Q4F12_04535 [Erysipelotrichaceae bacterium]|nr:hypothetical protein [Erysipelotrichaceae bacterium]
MKRIITILLVVLLSTCLCACNNNKNKQPNEIASLYEQGYEAEQTILFDSSWIALFMKDHDYHDAYKVVVKMDEKTYDKIIQCDTFEEEGLKQFLDIIEYLPNCTVTSMNDELPKEGELDQYIGKTIKDLEDEGYERTGYYLAEDGCLFYADGYKYSVLIQVEEVIKPEEMSYYSDYDLGQLTVKSMEFLGFSYRVLDWVS